VTRLGGAEAQFVLCPVYGPNGVECDDASPSEPGELRAKLGRRQAQGAEVVV